MNDKSGNVQSANVEYYQHFPTPGYMFRHIIQPGDSGEYWLRDFNFDETTAVRRIVCKSREEALECLGTSPVRFEFNGSDPEMERVFDESLATAHLDKEIVTYQEERLEMSKRMEAREKANR